ncbi:hypothetical protein JSO54_04310 [Riemerella anatipestifer]|uniref:hypothetical protein n=1 Tax=Riemerella anatipestifer TaxID=34085 RepID=UPI001374AA25|nr:hypothetical protein [Riemerella anatipestifer]
MEIQLHFDVLETIEKIHLKSKDVQLKKSLKEKQPSFDLVVKFCSEEKWSIENGFVRKIGF